MNTERVFEARTPLSSCAPLAPSLSSIPRFITSVLFQLASHTFNLQISFNRFLFFFLFNFPRSSRPHFKRSSQLLSSSYQILSLSLSLSLSISADMTSFVFLDISFRDSHFTLPPCHYCYVSLLYFLALRNTFFSLSLSLSLSLSFLQHCFGRKMKKSIIILSLEY
jgi:hypothetical protein